MRNMILAVGTAVLLTGTSALAQQTATEQAPAASETSSYLCALAGKCDGDASATEGTPTRAAPATKGFRLAAQQAPETPTRAAPTTRGFRLATQQPTTPAPTTRGFRLATGAAATQPSVAAPSTRSFQVARPTGVASTTTASPIASVRARGSRASRRNLVAANRGTVTPGVARSDLMLSFDLNSANMTPGAEARARTFAQALMMEELRGKRFLIEGHTDARGARDANIDLSRRRAQTVADYLIAQGVDRSRVEVRGVGPDAPLPGQTRAAESNRRVEAVLLS